MAAEAQPHEQQVWCGDCNGYLWSNDSPNHENPAPHIVKCPMKKDPLGKCMGELPGRPSPLVTFYIK